MTIDTVPNLTAAISEPSSDNWDVRSQTDPMDDVTNVTATLVASESPHLAFPYNDDETMLSIRCKKNQTDLLVATHTGVKTSYSSDYDDLGSHVRYRFDGGKPIGEYWTESTSHTAVFAPNPVALARRLAKTNEWIFEFTPYDTGPVSATFRPQGLEVVLPKIASACHWK
jgi:hypothetical protein